MLKVKDFQAMPFPEDFGSMDHLHEATMIHCEMMRMFEINARLMGCGSQPTSGMLEMLKAQ